jgi:hypothetical protein
MIGCNAAHTYLLTYFLSSLLTITKPYGKRYTRSHQNLRLPGRAVYDGIYAKSPENQAFRLWRQGALRNAPVFDPKFQRFRHPELQATSIANIGHAIIAVWHSTNDGENYSGDRIRRHRITGIADYADDGELVADRQSGLSAIAITAFRHHWIWRSRNDGDPDVIVSRVSMLLCLSPQIVVRSSHEISRFAYCPVPCDGSAQDHHCRIFQLSGYEQQLLF